MSQPNVSDEIRVCLEELLKEASERDVAKVKREEPARFQLLLAAVFEYDVRQGGFAQLRFNMKGRMLADIEDTLIAARAPVAQAYYVQPVRACLANKPEYQRLFASNYVDPNAVKDALQLISIDYLSRGMPFGVEAQEFIREGVSLL